MSSVQHITRFKWIISKLSKHVLEDQSETRMYSEEFTLDKSRVKFNLKFVPNYSENEENAKKQHCSLYLNSVNLDGRKSLSANYRLWMVDYYDQIITDYPGKFQKNL